MGGGYIYHLELWMWFDQFCENLETWSSSAQRKPIVLFNRTQFKNCGLDMIWKKHTKY